MCNIRQQKKYNFNNDFKTSNIVNISFVWFLGSIIIYFEQCFTKKVFKETKSKLSKLKFALTKHVQTRAGIFLFPRSVFSIFCIFIFRVLFKTTKLMLLCNKEKQFLPKKNVNYNAVFCCIRLGLKQKQIFRQKVFFKEN